MRAATGTYDNDGDAESGIIFDITRTAQSQGRTYLLEHESKAILEHSDIQTTGATLCTSPDEAAAAASQIGYPVALKVVSPKVIHKSDSGGVVLSLNNEDAVRQAYQTISATFSKHDMTGVAVQKMAPAGTEVIVGFTRDESFGPVLMFGLGGIFAEVLRDVTFRVLPITRDIAADMISEIKGYPILAGARGNPADIEALKDVLIRISDLAMKCPSIKELDINPLFLYPSGYVAVDARIFIDSEPRKTLQIEHRPENLVQLFYPRSIAILGATDTPGKLGYNVMYNLLSHYFQGKLYPVNPKKDKILGLKTYRSIEEIDAEIDAAIIIVPARAVSQAIEECCRKGIRYLIVESAGFAETGETGKNIQAQIKELVVAHDCRVLGPNCSGIINTHHNMVQSIGIIDELGKGNVGLIAQAGVYAAGMLTGLRKVLDFGIIATIGNKMDITETDILEFMGQDDHIDVIALYMEDVKDGRQFIDAARRISMKKPIIALKTGRTEEGRIAVSSHTASMAGNDAINSAAFRQSGVIRARDNEHLFGLVRAFSKQPPPKGPGTLVITYTGSLGVAATDMLYTAGLRLAKIGPETKQRLSTFIDGFLNVQNPIDCSFTMTPDQTKNLIESGLDDPDVSSIIIILQGEICGSYVDVLKNINFKGKPVMACVACKEFMMEDVINMEKIGIPVFSTPEAAADSLGEMYRYDQRRHKDKISDLDRFLSDRSFSLNDKKVYLRLLTPEDMDLWTDFVKSCSQRSLWMRFLSSFSPTPENARRYCDIDPDDEIAVVAETIDQGQRKFVAISRLVKCMPLDQAEYAVIVTDTWQHKTLGRLLLETCLELSRHMGIRIVHAEIIQENAPMNKVLNHCNFQLHSKDRNMLLLSRSLD